MDNESMGYLYSILEECERKCRICGKHYEHLFEKTPFYDENGPISNCPNANQKAALKRVIKKRLGRQNDSSNQEGTKV